MKTIYRYLWKAARGFIICGMVLATMASAFNPDVVQAQEGGEQSPTPTALLEMQQTEDPGETPTFLPNEEPSATPVPTQETGIEPPLEPSPTPEIPTDEPIGLPEITETPLDFPTETPAQTPTPEPSPQPGELAALRVPGTGEVIPDQYIVVYKPGEKAKGIENAIRAFITARGGQVNHVYDAALNGYSAVLPPGLLKQVLADPAVAYVEADSIITIADDNPVGSQAVQSKPTWGLDRVDQRSLPLDSQYAYTTTASDVNVYVVDSGIRYSHVDFSGRAVMGYDTYNLDGSDCNGHGTHVAGTIGGSTYGVAKGVRLYSVRVLGCDGNGGVSGVIAGLNWIINNHTKPAVANMSLGTTGSISTLEDAVQNVINSGVTVVIAAGNAYMDACDYTPARVPAAITVGATTSSDERPSYSNYGSCLDLFAPGSDITSSWNTGDSATYTWSGTSMAAPHVAGTAALYLAYYPSASPAQVANAIVNGATTGVVTNTGSGSPNRLLYSLQAIVPAAISPSGVTVTRTPVYTWSAVPNANLYQYQVLSGGSPIFTEEVSGATCSGGTCSHASPNSLLDGPYQWRVRAQVDGVWGTYSALRSFTVSGPSTLLSPLGNTYTRTPTYRWSRVYNATQYRYQLYRGDTLVFTKSAGSSSCTATVCSKKPDVTLAFGSLYKWRVQAYVGGTWLPYNDFQDFIVRNPVPATQLPAGNTYIRTPEYQWGEVIGAGQYEVQVYRGTTRLFTTAVQSSACSGGSCSTTPDVSLNYSGHKWRVRAHAGGVWNAWSAYRSFKVINPVPNTLAPIGTLYTTTPAYKWSKVTGATQYQLDVYLGDVLLLTTPVPSGACGSSTCQFKPAVALADGAYRWQVRAYAGGAWWGWSALRNFSVVNPVPRTIEPADIIYLRSPTYLWSRVAGATQYQYQVYRGGTLVFSRKVGSAVCGIDTCQETPAKLLNYTGYKWRVRTYLGGSWKSYSPFRTFTVAN